MERVTIVTGGDLLFVFDAEDAERIAAQLTVMIGANLDVDAFKLNRETWERVRPKLAADVEITDCRREVAK